MSFMKYILNMCIYLPMLLGLFLIVTKLTSTQTFKLNNKRYVNIIEKNLIAKDTYAMVIKIGNNAYVGIASPNGFQMIQQLNEREVVELENKLNPIKDNNSSDEFNLLIKNIKATIISIGKRLGAILKKRIEEQRRI